MITNLNVFQLYMFCLLNYARGLRVFRCLQLPQEHGGYHKYKCPLLSCGPQDWLPLCAATLYEIEKNSHEAFEVISAETFNLQNSCISRKKKKLSYTKPTLKALLSKQSLFHFNHFFCVYLFFNDTVP